MQRVLRIRHCTLRLRTVSLKLLTSFLQVTDWGALRQALQQLTGLTSDRIMAVELLWTPRDNSDYLTRQQLERDYPDLVVLGSQGKAPLGART